MERKGETHFRPYHFQRTSTCMQVQHPTSIWGGMLWGYMSTPNLMYINNLRAWIKKLKKPEFHQLLIQREALASCMTTDTFTPKATSDCSHSPRLILCTKQHCKCACTQLSIDLVNQIYNSQKHQNEASSASFANEVKGSSSCANSFFLDKDLYIRNQSRKCISRILRFLKSVNTDYPQSFSLKNVRWYYF